MGSAHLWIVKGKASKFDTCKLRTKWGQIPSSNDPYLVWIFHLKQSMVILYVEYVDNYIHRVIICIANIYFYVFALFKFHVNACVCGSLFMWQYAMSKAFWPFHIFAFCVKLVSDVKRHTYVRFCRYVCFFFVFATVCIQ